MKIDPPERRVSSGGKGVWYRLRIGPISDKATANKLFGQLKSQGHPDCLVIAGRVTETPYQHRRLGISAAFNSFVGCPPTIASSAAALPSNVEKFCSAISDQAPASGPSVT